MDSIVFSGWFALLRTVFMTGLAYISLVLLLRISGRRTLSKMNAFDLVVTVALGSTLATVMLSDKISLLQGVSAFSMLIGMQFIVTWTSVRYPWVRKLVTGEPALLFHQGNMLPQALRRVRVTRAEIYAAIRSAGIADIESVEAVVLETDGSFSVIGSHAKRGNSSLASVPYWPIKSGDEK